MTDSPASTRNRIDLLLFAGLTAIISGSLWLLLAWMGGDVTAGGSLAIFAVATSGPSMAALILYLTRTRRLPRSERRYPVSAPWLWVPAALVLGAAPAVLAGLIVAPEALAASIADVPDVVASLGGAGMFIVTFLIAGPLAEEFGWRGYAQPRLRRSLGLLATSAVLGVAWWVWHIPLFFLPGTAQAYMGFFTLESLGFAISFVPLCLIYLFVSERLGGGVWAAILLHFTSNVSLTLLPDASVLASVARLAVIFVLAAGVYFAWRPDARGPLASTA
ncbi:CPBP family intramembrane metalloprotease [Agromyces humatus]|uniref:CPBP family intramembrane metalloprotease n=2 Tax=Agromyces humatus TaxID=279573 RepID=A0ABN2KZE2_9MICO